MSTDTKKSNGRGRGRQAEPKPMTEEERIEHELAEEARINSGSWDSVAPGKAQDFGASFRRMLGLLAPHKWAFGFASLLGAIGVVLAVIAPKVLAEATNIIFAGLISLQLPAGVTQEQVVAGLRAEGQQDLANIVEAATLTPGAGIDFVALSQVVIIVLMLYIAASLLSWVQGYVINVIMVRAMWKLREDVEAKVHRLPLRYFDRVQRGELISRVTNDIDNITQTMQQSLSSALTSVLTVVGVLIMMFSISWQLALVTLVSLPLMGVIFGIIGPKSQSAFGVQWKKVGRLNARVEESFSGHALVKVFGREQDASNKFRAENEELY
jgi:ATP-binding cassette, subfamily B, multidrug efflux pump